MKARTPVTELADRRLTVKEAAEFLGISEYELRHLANSREIPVYRRKSATGPGRGHMRFSLEDLRRWDAQNKIPARRREQQEFAQAS